VTIAKLRWLLGKATSKLGEKRIADLSPKDVYAWRLTVPEGHRFEATQALRQVLNRAVAWGVLDFNPAKRGVPNPQRRPNEKRPFESWQQIEAIAARLGPVYGPMVIFGAATGLRPSELFGLEQHDVDRELGVVYVRRAFANGRIKNTKTRLSTRAVPLQAKAVDALDRLPASVNPILFPNARGGRIDFRIFGRRHWRPADRCRRRTDPWALRPAPHLRDLRAPRWRSGVRGLALHRLEHRNDRPPLRPSRPRQPRARSRATRCARARAGGGRWVDVVPKPRKRAQQQEYEASPAPRPPERGRSVDAAARSRRSCRQRKELISRKFAKPSNGLEPLTPSLPSQADATAGGRLQVTSRLSRSWSSLPVAVCCARSAP
jgi:hypothetical protein